MDAVSILTLIGLVIGIIAGVVQVLDFLEKQREKKRSLPSKGLSPQVPQVPGTVRYMQLIGLKLTEGEQLFHALRVSGSEAQEQELIDFYKGSPLTLKIVATTIQELLDISKK